MTRSSMPSERTGAPVTLRYWAGARAAAGVETDDVAGCATVGDAVSAACGLHPDLVPVAAVSTLLLDGRAVGVDEPVGAGALVEILPPFAGG